MELQRTDLALESRELFKEAEGYDLDGAAFRTEVREGFSVTEVRVLTREAADKICKPIGSYFTVELGRFMRREDDAFASGARVIAGILEGLLPKEPGPVLVAGLGNPSITPDAVGHIAVRNTLVTRHLRSSGGAFSAFGDVAAIEPGVLGTTGIESADIIESIARRIRPKAVVAVDALASRSIDRLCRTVQISDSGIVPGSGVGNARRELSAKTLGVPVIAVGVPTVVDAATLLIDLAQEAGMKPDAEAIARNRGLIVTPRDVDANVNDISRLIGYGVDLALHPGLTVGDIDMFIG